MGWVLKSKDMDVSLLIWLALHSQEDFQKSANGEHQMQPVASPPSVNNSDKTRVKRKEKEEVKINKEMESKEKEEKSKTPTPTGAQVPSI